MSRSNTAVKAASLAAMTPERVAEAKQMLGRGCKIGTVARTLGVSRASIYRTCLYEMTPWGETDELPPTGRKAKLS